MDDMAAYYPPPATLHQNPQYPYHHHHHHPPPPPHPLPPPYAPVQPAPPHQQSHHLPHQFHPHYQPPPLSSYAPPPYPQSSSHDQVRTLFVAGLPEDVKPREIFNLFREFPGYESSHLRTPSPTSQPFAFVVFVDQISAIGALQALNGLEFDLEKGSTLFIDLAKSNSRSKRSRSDDENPGFDKRAKGSSAFSRGNLDSGVGSIHMPGIGNSAHDTIGYPSTQSHANVDRAGSGLSAAKFSNPSTYHAPRNAPPCPTLFVASLGPACSEQELNEVFSSCSGFLKLKMQGTYGAPVAFVDFKDTASSTEALNRLQGTVLHSSPSGEGMRLEYAKSRMGMRSKKSR